MAVEVMDDPDVTSGKQVVCEPFAFRWSYSELAVPLVAALSRPPPITLPVSGPPEYQRCVVNGRGGNVRFHRLMPKATRLRTTLRSQSDTSPAFSFA